MNGRLARRIRKEIYMDRKEETKYKQLEDGSIVSTGIRAKYRKFKKEWKIKDKV